MLSQTFQLVRKVLFFTSNSRKQTTPKLVRNPRLTKKGLLEVKPKSYNYDLAAPHVTNKHLYWNRVEQNRILRTQYRLRKFKKLGIRPLYVPGVQPIERPLAELLRELRDRRLIMVSPERTLANIIELVKRHGKEANQYKDLTDYVIGQLDKQVASMSLREFSMYCMILEKFGKQPDLRLFTHFYHHLLSAEAAKKPMRLEIFAQLCRFFFSGKVQYPIKLIEKDQRPFVIFEDNNPRPKSFQQVVDSLYSPTSLQALLQGNKYGDAKKFQAMVRNTPGSVAARLSQLA